MIDLASELPILAPRAIAWAKWLSTQVAAHGAPLNAPMIQLARHVRVLQPERIRVGVVDQMPVPDDQALYAAALQTGLFGPDIEGLTLGHSILILRGHENDVRLLSHEFRHVSQYEACGSIDAFLAVHLRHLVMYGYLDSPFEVDARAHEYHAV